MSKQNDGGFIYVGDGTISGKITFKNVYSDFRRRHPHLAKEVVHWHPIDILMIRIYLDDGMILTYDYWNHKATVNRANWRRDHLHLG